MSDFNAKQYYGYSLQNDPALSTSARNFEFVYARPEMLERAIQKVNESASGGNVKEKKITMLSKLRQTSGGGGKDVTSASRLCEQDIETRISMDMPETASTDDNDLVNELNRNDTSLLEDCKGNDDDSDGSDRNVRLDGYASDQEIVTALRGENRIEKVELDIFPKPQWATIEQPLEKTSIHKFDVQHPQSGWININSPLDGNAQRATATVPKPVHQAAVQGYPPFAAAASMSEEHQKNIAAGVMPMPQRFPFYNPQQLAPMQNLHFFNMTYNNNEFNDYNPNAYLVEDSDLEEMVQRANYQGLYRERPTAQVEAEEPEEHGYAEFINIGPKQPYLDMSCLKSTAPMRFSGQTSPEASQQPDPNNDSQKTHVVTEKLNNNDAGPPIKKHAKLVQMKVVKAPKVKATEATIETKQTPRKADPSTSRAARAFEADIKKRANQPTVLKASRMKAGDIGKNIEASLSEKSARAKQAPDLETLKQEKCSIFNKMTIIQERMTEALDNLKLKLLEKHVPNSPYDKNRRERNGFEFSVRFLRNFLYPLQSMIEGLHATTKDQLHSMTSNEASQRVLAIFQLCLHALQTYKKQLKHFMIDQVPQKLASLLETIYNATRICLEKGVFNQHDVVIGRLLDRCALVHACLEDMHSKKFIDMQEDFCKSAASTSSKKMSADKYSLKMCMNGLNMYEPKLVAKNKTSTARSNVAKAARRTFRPVGVATKTAITKAGPPELPAVRKSVRSMKRFRRFPGATKKSNAVEQPHSPDGFEPEQEINTCMQNLSEFGAALPNELTVTLQNLVATTQTILQTQKAAVSQKNSGSEKERTPSTSGALNRAITDALKNITHDEVRDVLEPWLRRLGKALEQQGITNSDVDLSTKKRRNKPV